MEHEGYVTPDEAAKYLGLKRETLKGSRRTGILSGVKAPKHYVLGTRTPRYKLSDLDAWVLESSPKNK